MRSLPIHQSLIALDYCSWFFRVRVLRIFLAIVAGEVLRCSKKCVDLVLENLLLCWSWKVCHSNLVQSWCSRVCRSVVVILDHLDLCVEGCVTDSY
ncbi:hypothetical protein Hanom_Chr08g00718141 [Helianthus anomalus]